MFSHWPLVDVPITSLFNNKKGHVMPDTTTIFVPWDDFVKSDAALQWECDWTQCRGGTTYTNLWVSPSHVTAPKCSSCGVSMTLSGLSVDVELKDAVAPPPLVPVYEPWNLPITREATSINATEVLAYLDATTLHPDFIFHYKGEFGVDGVAVSFKNAVGFSIVFDGAREGRYDLPADNPLVVNAFVVADNTVISCEEFYTACAPCVKRERPICQYSAQVAHWITKVLTTDTVADMINDALNNDGLDSAK